MGNAISRTGRKLPTKAAPSWAGARTDPSALNVSRTAPPPMAQGSKTADINSDGSDPHLLANLTALGAVRVPSAQTIQSSSSIHASIAARQLSEEQAIGKIPQNRLLASTLTQLLDERRIATPNGKDFDLNTISKKYNIESPIVSRLTRWVNSPSAGDTIVTRTTAREDEEIILTKAVWV
ncbi:hypothetical protein FRB94_003685 [Tulasnella sp. JGI-2019a]|nr:hypothetical protein FRB93_012015 [Tulasnella sp. JGI-2019a]KAG9002711.1 hypothetical protein FRB94_003685 [Tulasnella sp. JGI-2019a]KAG9035373.1 hypothetical protein FRB95_011393 [Tulasnella sp. JGI-2019a]